MLEIGETGAAVIDARESRLRVLATCAATIIGGWAVLAASQLPDATGGRLFYWAATGFWSVYWGAFLIARALGRRRTRTTWLFAAGYVFYVPAQLLLSRMASGFAPAGAKPINAVTGGNLFLGIASALVLAAVAVAGLLLEPRRGGHRFVAGVPQHVR